jgi:hypothetical protein
MEERVDRSKGIQLERKRQRSSEKEESRREAQVDLGKSGLSEFVCR